MTKLDDRLDEELRDHFQSTDTEDPEELHRLHRLYSLDRSAPSSGEHRALRVRRSLVAGVVGVAVAVATAIPLTVALTQRQASPASGPSPSPSPTVTPRPSALLDSLNAYVRSQGAREAQAAARDPSQAAFGDLSVAERSAPVPYEGGYIAVAAFGFDPSGKPVQVLSYSGGRWQVIAALAPPVDPGTAVHPDSLPLASSTDDIANISVGYATGSAPDFLIPLAGGGCGRGPVVSHASGAWQYAPFATVSAPTTDLLGGNPRFVADTLVSDNACAAAVPQNQRVTSTWRYNATTGEFTATEQPGWPPSP